MPTNIRDLKRKASPERQAETERQVQATLEQIRTRKRRNQAEPAKQTLAVEAPRDTTRSEGIRAA